MKRSEERREKFSRFARRQVEILYILLSMRIFEMWWKKCFKFFLCLDKKASFLRFCGFSIVKHTREIETRIHWHWVVEAVSMISHGKCEIDFAIAHSTVKKMNHSRRPRTSHKRDKNQQCVPVFVLKITNFIALSDCLHTLKLLYSIINHFLSHRSQTQDSDCS